MGSGHKPLVSAIAVSLQEKQPSHMDQCSPEIIYSRLEMFFKGTIMENLFSPDDESGKFKTNDHPSNTKSGHHNIGHKEKEMKKNNCDTSTESPSSPEAKGNDFSKFRLSQDFASQIGVKKILTNVPVRKPSKQEFVRVHPDEAWRMEIALIEIKDEREVYLVAPELLGELSEFTTPACLFTTISRQKVLTLWPVKLPGLDGRSNPWHESALDAAKLAINSWVRVSANMSLGAYEVFEARSEMPAPEWPESGMNFNSLLGIAFRGRIIDSMEHPIVNALLGVA